MPTVIARIAVVRKKLHQNESGPRLKQPHQRQRGQRAQHREADTRQRAERALPRKVRQRELQRGDRNEKPADDVQSDGRAAPRGGTDRGQGDETRAKACQAFDGFHVDPAVQ